MKYLDFAYSASGLLLNSWQAITITFGYYKWSAMAAFLGITVGKSGNWGREMYTPNTPPTYLSTDKIIIGGPNSFLGEISRIQIFSKGSYPRSGKIVA